MLVKLCPIFVKFSFPYNLYICPLLKSHIRYLENIFAKKLERVFKKMEFLENKSLRQQQPVVGLLRQPTNN